MNFRTIGILLLVVGYANAQPYGLDWVNSFGGLQNDACTDIAVDVNGDSYVVGWFEGTADLDPQSTVAEHTSLGGKDGYVSRLNANGELTWVLQFSGTSNVEVRAVSVFSNEIFVTGIFAGTVDFTPTGSPTELTSTGYEDVFICKVDQFGSVIWAKQVGGNLSDQVFSIATDSESNVVVTGYFWSTADFDPSPVDFELSSHGANDVFVLKLDSDGELVWAINVGGFTEDYGYSIALDENDEIIVCGFFTGTADFDPSIDQSLLTSIDYEDAFVSKYDSNGQFLWANSIGGAQSVFAVSTSTGNDNSVFVSGYFTGTASINSGSTELTSLGGNDGFTIKLNSVGVLQWAKQFGGLGEDFIFDCEVNQAGDVFAVGRFEGIIDLDPGIGNETVNSSGSADGFISQLDENGNYVWGASFGGPMLDAASSVAVTDNGSALISAGFSGTLNFNLGSSQEQVSAIGLNDVLLSKISPQEVTSVANYPNNKFEVFLDPHSNQLIIHVAEDLTEFSYEIYDVTGRSLMLESISNSTTLKIDISPFSKTGMRLLVLKSEGICQTEKF